MGQTVFGLTAVRLREIRLGAAAVVVLTYFILLILLVRRGKRRYRHRSYIKQLLRRIKGAFRDSAYGEELRFLSKKGAAYLIGREVTPEEYYLFRLLMAIFCGMLTIAAGGIFLLPFGAIAGFYLPKAILLLSDRTDNEKLLYDVKNVFDTLLMKTQAGVFLTTALADCYKVVQNRRLKQALLQMNMELIARNDIAAAVDRLQDQFGNQHIDSLCMTLRQSMSSGQTVAALKDMSDQLTELQEVIHNKLKSRLDAKIQAIQILLYAAILIMSVYGAFLSLGSFSFAELS